jgi:hypothetical protein
MSINRISVQRWRKPLDQPIAVGAAPGFIACPVCVLPAATAQGWAWQREILRLAYEAARANNAVPNYHKRLFSNWN